MPCASMYTTAMGALTAAPSGSSAARASASTLPRRTRTHRGAAPHAAALLDLSRASSARNISTRNS